MGGGRGRGGTTGGGGGTTGGGDGTTGGGDGTTGGRGGTTGGGVGTTGGGREGVAPRGQAEAGVRCSSGLIRTLAWSWGLSLNLAPPLTAV